MKDNWLIFGRVLQGVGAVGFLVALLFFLLVKAPETPISQPCHGVTIEITFDGACQSFQQTIGKNLVEGVGMQEALTNFFDGLGLGAHHPKCPSYDKHRTYGFSLRPSYPGTIRIELSVPICNMEDTMKKLMDTGFVIKQGSKPKVP